MKLAIYLHLAAKFIFASSSDLVICSLTRLHIRSGDFHLQKKMEIEIPDANSSDIHVRSMLRFSDFAPCSTSFVVRKSRLGLYF